LVGTQSLKFDNQVHRLELDEERNSIQREVFLHKDGEIWHLSSSPSDKNVFTSVYNKISGKFFEIKLSCSNIIICFQIAANKTCSKETAIWRTPAEINPSEEIHNLEFLTRLNTESLGDDIKCSFFHPTEENKILSVIDGSYVVWDIKEAGQLCEVIEL